MTRPLHGLYAILDVSSLRGESVVTVAEDYLEGGLSILQLRDKGRLESTETRKKFLETARALQHLKSQKNFLLLINDDLETARKVGADGIHVGRDDPSLEECRKKLGPEKIIGYSAHSLEEALDAEKRGADYVAFGAIFPTKNKGAGHPIQGLEKLRVVVQAVTIPVVAIGGIGRNNLQSVIGTGVAMVAMISALSETNNRVTTARYFCSLFKNERVSS